MMVCSILTNLKANSRALEYKLHKGRRLCLFFFVFLLIDAKHLEKSLHLMGA